MFSKLALEATLDGLQESIKSLSPLVGSTATPEQLSNSGSKANLPFVPKDAGECRALLLLSALRGCSFLAQHAIRRKDAPEDGHGAGRVYFALTRDGAVAGEQRKVFGACFVAMAFAETARALKALCTSSSAPARGTGDPASKSALGATEESSFNKAICGYWEDALAGLESGLAGAGLGPTLPALGSAATATAISDQAGASAAQGVDLGTTGAVSWERTHDALQCAAGELFGRVLEWSKDPAALGRPVHSSHGESHAWPLAVPMISLSVMMDFLQHGAEGDVVAFKGLTGKEQRVEMAAAVLLHQLDGGSGNGIMLECVRSDGAPDLSTAGSRQFNPGHAIEAGWFMLDYLSKYPEEAADVLRLEDRMRGHSGSGCDESASDSAAATAASAATATAAASSDPSSGVIGGDAAAAAAATIRARCLRTIAACFAAGWDGDTPPAIGTIVGEGGMERAGPEAASTRAARNVAALVDRGKVLARERSGGGEGGILYFLDAGGVCPQELEWDMKLWWPHCEALVACSMGHALASRGVGVGPSAIDAPASDEGGTSARSGARKAEDEDKEGGAPWLELAALTARWIDEHIATRPSGSPQLEAGAGPKGGPSGTDDKPAYPATQLVGDGARDRVGGEWLGYVSRDGRPTHSFVGGAYKGAFHVPRALLLASKLLRGREI